MPTASLSNVTRWAWWRRSDVDRESSIPARGCSRAPRGGGMVGIVQHATPPFCVGLLCRPRTGCAQPPGAGAWAVSSRQARPERRCGVAAPSGGLRLGEALGLRWIDVNSDGPKLVVRQTLERAGGDAAARRTLTAERRRLLAALAAAKDRAESRRINASLGDVRRRLAAVQTGVRFCRTEDGAQPPYDHNAGTGGRRSTDASPAPVRGTSCGRCAVARLGTGVYDDGRHST